jgi:hypothetical protein
MVRALAAIALALGTFACSMRYQVHELIRDAPPGRGDRMLLYLIVFVTGLAGMTQLSWWAAVIGACALSLRLMAEDRPLLSAHAATWDAAQLASNLTIAVIASSTAFAAGRVTAMLWGL